MSSALAPETESVVRRVWAARLGVPVGALEARGTVFVDRPDLTAAVVVRLGGTTVVAAPDPALSDLRRVARNRLLDVGSLLAVLEFHRPILLGKASLSFADSGSMRPDVSGGAVRDATDAETEALLSVCSGDERDESGLAGMGVRHVVLDRAGQLAALAGFEVWDNAMAHLGVAVAPRCRGQGFGRIAAAAAARHALGVGLVPQWRCRLDNVSSARVRDRVGFVQLGEQIAIDLAAIEPEVR